MIDVVVLVRGLFDRFAQRLYCRMIHGDFGRITCRAIVLQIMASVAYRLLVLRRFFYQYISFNYINSQEMYPLGATSPSVSAPDIKRDGFKPSASS